ncbi:hypothetical protein QRZ34_28280 [Klebsiella michiganensis]|uniref:hypothetical protein n=1 Tax=Klebsiella michiganensis TaxID=1134687 RepID=UPI002570698B|nr:hypothetical protein [Klebsiella michiganensis]MDL4454908.1 hypothetical protein [Klebsiella michiganensis]
MRIAARSESREALTVLSLVLGANCDYNPDSDYPFEIMLPFEDVAKAMGVLHVYESGRKAYDVALHALSVLEQLDYLIVSRGQDTDTGQEQTAAYLADGELLHQSRHPGGRNSPVAGSIPPVGHQERADGKSAQETRTSPGAHCASGDRHRTQALSKNRLKQIKRWVVSPDLQNLKKDAETAIEGELARRQQDEQRLDTLLDETAAGIKSRLPPGARNRTAFIRPGYSGL